MKKLVIKDREAVKGKTFEELMAMAEEVEKKDLKEDLKKLDDEVLVGKIIDKYIDMTGKNVILNCEVVLTPKGLTMRVGGNPDVRNILRSISGVEELMDEYVTKLSKVAHEFVLKLQELVCESNKTEGE